MEEPITSKQWFVFTFGCGQPNEGMYVKVFGTYGEARRKMIDKYGREWSFQYTMQEWEDWTSNKPAWLPAETLLEVIE